MVKNLNSKIRLSHEYFSNSLEWHDTQHLCELVVESPKLMRDIVRELTTENGEHGLYITQAGEAMNFSSDIDVIFNPLKLDFNNRKAMTALLKMMVKTSLSEDFYFSTNELKTKIVKHLSDIIAAENFIFEVEPGEFSIDAIAKAANIHIVGDEDNFVELITDYVVMMTELAYIKLFIFVNLRSFLDDNELNQLVQNLQNHQINVLLLENQTRSKIKQSSRMVIDNDLCEIWHWPSKLAHL